jgi:hypothetical protein
MRAENFAERSPAYGLFCLLPDGHASHNNLINI